MCWRENLYNSGDWKNTHTSNFSLMGISPPAFTFLASPAAFWSTFPLILFPRLLTFPLLPQSERTENLGVSQDVKIKRPSSLIQFLSSSLTASSSGTFFIYFSLLTLWLPTPGLRECSGPSGPVTLARRATISYKEFVISHLNKMDFYL